MRLLNNMSNSNKLTDTFVDDRYPASGNYRTEISNAYPKACFQYILAGHVRMFSGYETNMKYKIFLEKYYIKQREITNVKQV